MKVKVIGCGNAFSNLNYNQCFLLEENQKKMLIDFGYQIPAALKNSHISFKEIDFIYISHLHADHVGGLEYLAFMRYDWEKRCRDAKDGNYAPVIIGNERVLFDLWETSLKGGLEYMEGFMATLETFFIPRPIKENETFLFEGWTVSLIPQVHIEADVNHIMPTYGLMLKKDGHKTIYFTTDSQHASHNQIEKHYQEADIIIQDCEILPAEQMSVVHANYFQLAGYPEANSRKLEKSVKAKMLLSHYQDFYNYKQDYYGNPCDWDDKAREDGFAGFVKIGQELII